MWLVNTRIHHPDCISLVQLCFAWTEWDISGYFHMLGSVSEAQSKYNIASNLPPSSFLGRISQQKKTVQWIWIWENPRQALGLLWTGEAADNWDFSRKCQNSKGRRKKVTCSSLDWKREKGKICNKISTCATPVYSRFGEAPWTCSLHWKCAMAYQELADELGDGEGQLCDIFHCGGIGSCRPINPVYRNHIHLAGVQYGLDKPFNPGRFGTQSPVDSAETRMLGVPQAGHVPLCCSLVLELCMSQRRLSDSNWKLFLVPDTHIWIFFLRWCNNTFQNALIQEEIRYFNKWDNICRA